MRKDRSNPTDQRWLTLSQASTVLGVTPNTLRRWADRGQIPSFVTPGGHRRFPLAAITSFVPSHRARRPPLAAIGASSDRMARAYRRARPTPRSGEPAGWLAHLSNSERVRFRRRGMQLVGSLLTYLDADREGRAALFEVVEGHARDYGLEAAEAGGSLSDTVEG